MTQTWLWWSTGKDSAWTLHELRRAHAELEVTGLVTTVDARTARVAMHGVRRELVEAQARAAGLPLHVMQIEWPASNAAYEAALQGVFEAAAGAGVGAMAFGDLHLEDVRRYREELLAGTAFAAAFPLWGRDTRALAHEMVGAGLEAWVTCVDPTQAPPSLVGRRYDAAFLAALPSGIDPCGERGEFHTFAVAGPMFDAPIRTAPGLKHPRGAFVFTDLTLPA